LGKATIRPVRGNSERLNGSVIATANLIAPALSGAATTAGKSEALAGFGERSKIQVYYQRLKRKGAKPDLVSNLPLLRLAGAPDATKELRERLAVRFLRDIWQFNLVSLAKVILERGVDLRVFVSPPI
jgi:hypothetical protein